MRSALFAALTLVGFSSGCSDDVSGTLTLKPDSTTVVVNQTTFLTAYLNDGMAAGSATPTPVDVSYSMDPMGIISLTPHNGIQLVTGLAVGNVVVTASGFNQTAKVGFTVVSP
jgi:hypothetical protein